jgi:nucleotide-binding universal stress UspA family protein
MTARPVVVGVDGSEGSLLALEWAAREAERHGSPLRLVSAPATPPRMRARKGATPAIGSELRDFAMRALDAAVTRSKEIVPGLVTDTRVLSGPAAIAITEASEGAVMVVVGSRGIGGFAAMLLGSVSRYTAMHAACPVVVVREQSVAVQREIVVGIRDTQESTEALTFAFEEAALSGAELVTVHSERRFHPAIRAIGEPSRVTADITRSLAETLAAWRDKYPTVAVRPDVVLGHPAQVLAEYSARADLVIVGRHGGSTGSGGRPAIGSIQHAVLNHARGPVAVVPEGSSHRRGHEQPAVRVIE